MIPESLLLDLETSPSGVLLKTGAVISDRVLFRTGNFDRRQALAELDSLAGSAACVLGHNLLRHDLRVLATLAPGMHLLRLPVVDTLFLSPICFPENPYHHLVKDYKLVSEALNDPVSDARLAGRLLDDEIASLKGLLANAPDVFRCLWGLVTGGVGIDPRLAAGMEMVFGSIAAGVRPDDGELLDLLRRVLGPLCCVTAASRISKTDLATSEARWAWAFCLAWLRVAGGASVLPPWVRLEHPLVLEFIQRLREVPCDAPECGYCREIHNPEVQLQKYFGFREFRPIPAAPGGGSLQRAIVVAGMRGESMLAILPTGGGKSLCFQLPALIRNVRRGQLTIVVSPLQALMKDQVDGMRRRTGLQNVAALNGLLTGPERGAVLRAVRMGDTAILYVSPEQLRSRSFCNAVKTREIGCWVLDEAHCLSKWGHDFRPDYLYVGRFILSLAQEQGGVLPAIACFTATAKKDVIEEIRDYFIRSLNVDLTPYEGGVERDNLAFEVQTVGSHTKGVRIDELLHARLGQDGTGSAVVFRATRQDAEETATFLRNRGWTVEFFHAGMTVPEKKRIQDAFLAGQVRVICATNAFGMGIDKDDVRLVIHGDTPGSLENYLQEAGRAGRDRNPASCVLLYDEEDCERQFRMGAMGELSRHDVAQILRGLRKAAKARRSDEVVITTGELLRDEDVDVEIDGRARDADTKVRAAIAWLERAKFIERNSNQNDLIQARLRVQSLDEARAKLATLKLSERESSLWLAIIREMLEAGPTEALSVDQIALLPEFQFYQQDAPVESTGPAAVRETRQHEYLTGKILKVLNSMMGVGLLKKDTLLTAFVRYKVADHSGIRLQRVLGVDRDLVGLLRELEPDPEGWMPLDGRLLNQELLNRGAEVSPAMVGQLLQSLAQDGRGFAGQQGSIELRLMGRDAYRVRLRRSWDQIVEIAERRRKVARVILDQLLGRVPGDTPPRGDLLVKFSLEELERAIEKDLLLRSDIKDLQAAIERSLMFLHEQNVIILQKGLAIFRSAMTIKVLPESDGRKYTREDYEALEHHYSERKFQVHVMNEYARYGLDKIKAALDLVLAYFTMEKNAFIARFFGDRRELLDRATTARSYRSIVDALGNRDQMRIVTAPPDKNLLILAGPGSGKTKTVVHRCAYLLRVKRVKPRAILVCCFNRRAAVELRRRLAQLVGRDAIGVTVQTYHGLALRILGLSMTGRAKKDRDDLDFDRLIVDATKVLRAETVPPGVEPDDVRDRLLTGFEHILVDEYQDIDAPQYEMISAIAGRTLKDDAGKLSILAVGDDDQSIYGFRGANVEFIRRFEADYRADVARLVENYRSTAFIIEASNRLIARNTDRMKTKHPIRIDQSRQLMPAGGTIGSRDPETRGRVSVVETRDGAGQAWAIVAELKRLRDLGVEAWSSMAVLSRTRDDLALVRNAAERAGIPVSWPLERGKVPSLTRIREVREALARLADKRDQIVSANSLAELMALPESGRRSNPWTQALGEVVEEWGQETDNEPAPVAGFVEYAYEALAQRRRDEQIGSGVVLNTIHAAKGTEYDHVLVCGDWSGTQRAAAEEERRILYVGITRARSTLSVFHRLDAPNPFIAELVGPCFHARHAAGEVVRQDVQLFSYDVLGLGDIYLDFAGRHDAGHQIHAELAALDCGALLSLESQGGRLALVSPRGVPVAMLSASATAEWVGRVANVASVRVLGFVERFADDTEDESFRAQLRVSRWSVPFCEVIWRRGGRAG